MSQWVHLTTGWCLRLGLLCIFLSHLSKLAIALYLFACLSKCSPDWLTFCYVSPKSFDLVLFWDQMAWWVINLSLWIFHLQRSARYREAKKSERSGRGRQGEGEGGIKSYGRVLAGPSNGLKSKGQSVGYIIGLWSTGQTKQLTLTQPLMRHHIVFILYHILFN